MNLTLTSQHVIFNSITCAESHFLAVGKKTTAISLWSYEVGTKKVAVHLQLLTTCCILYCCFHLFNVSLLTTLISSFVLATETPRNLINTALKSRILCIDL